MLGHRIDSCLFSVVLAILLALVTVGTVVELIVHFRRKGAGKILDDISIAADPVSDPAVAVSDGAALIETDGGRRGKHVWLSCMYFKV